MPVRRARGLLHWVVFAAVALVVIGAAGYLVLHFARPVVSVTEAVEAPVVQAFYSTGTVEPEREYLIRSNIAGVITEVRVDKGDAVKQGQVLAIVSEPELQLVQRRAAAELREKLALAAEDSPVLQEYDVKISATGELLEIAKREQNRVADVVKTDAASQMDFDRALERVKQYWSDLESLKANRARMVLELNKDVEVAQAALDIAMWNLEQQTLKSPIDGVVLDRPLSLGTRLAINDHVMEVADVSPANLVMRAQVDEEDKTKAMLGQAVQMTLYSFPGKVFEGKVSRIYDKADLERRTFEVDVRLNELNDKLSPGMTGELAFVMASKDKAIIIPSQALQSGSVYAVRNNKIEKLKVEVGLRSVERTEIMTGVNVGDRVLFSPIGELSEGRSVRTNFVDPATAAGLNKPLVEESNFKGFN